MASIVVVAGRLPVSDALLYASLTVLAFTPGFASLSGGLVEDGYCGHRAVNWYVASRGW
jgi:hypothetical protein